MVTNGPVNRIALPKKKLKVKRLNAKYCMQIRRYPAKNMSRNQLPGTAKISIASSVSVSPIRRNGMHASINRFENKNMALAGACD